MSKEMILNLKGVTKSYKAPDSPKTDVLRGIGLEVYNGESVAIIGPSGSGKTTLLNIIGSMDSPSEGSIVFNGQDTAELNDIQLAALRNEDIGFVFQLHHLLPQCTVLENILIPTLISSQKDGAEERALKLLERVGLAEQANSQPNRLSGGESQRVAVIRALINKPKLILADEPTGSLDKENSENIAQLLSDLNKEENTTLIVVTHSETLAQRMDKTFTLANGKLINTNE